MWFIFIVSCVVIALAALFVIWVGNKVILSIRKQNKAAEMNEAACDSAKKVIKKEIEKEFKYER